MPKPVRPRPRTSRPAKESGSVAAWMGVGVVSLGLEDRDEGGGHAEGGEGRVGGHRWVLPKAGRGCSARRELVRRWTWSRRKANRRGRRDASRMPGQEEATRGRTGRVVVSTVADRDRTTNPPRRDAWTRRGPTASEGPAEAVPNGSVASGDSRRKVAGSPNRTAHGAPSWPAPLFSGKDPSHASHVPHRRHWCRRRRPHPLRLRLRLDVQLARRRNHARRARPLRVEASTRRWPPRSRPTSSRRARSSSAPTPPTPRTRCSPLTARPSRASTSTSSTPSPPSSASRPMGPGRVRHDHPRRHRRQVRHGHLELHHQRRAQEAGQHGSDYKAGTEWIVAKGNPKGVNMDDACGKNIGAQKGTVQLDDLTARRRSAPTPASRRST